MSFQERFKGRTSVMDKSGIVGIISQKGQSIDKAQILQNNYGEESLTPLRKQNSDPPRFEYISGNNSQSSYKNDNQNYLAFKGQQNINSNYQSQQQNQFLNTYDLGRNGYQNGFNNNNSNNFSNGSYQTSNQNFGKNMIPQKQQVQYNTFNMEEYQLVAIPKFAFRSLDNSPILRQSSNVLQSFSSIDNHYNSQLNGNGYNSNLNSQMTKSEIIDTKQRKNNDRMPFMNNAQNIIVSNKDKQNNNNYTYNLDHLADKHKEIIDKLDQVKKGRGNKTGKQSK